MLNILVQQVRNISRREIGIINKKIRHKSTDRVWKAVKMNKEMLPSSRTDPVIMTLNSPEFQSIFTPELQSLTDLFKKYNYELRIAGGAVRDILMGITPQDLDFATDATPDQMKEMFNNENIRMINMKGEKHGTITARINDKENFEVTTLRIDVLTNGRHAQIEFVKDWKLDANRRDLTINSMFLDLEGKVYDYYYGYNDLQNKRIAFVGDPNTRICEDYLRILRYFRFYGRIMDDADKHDETTIKAIKKNISGLERISGERIWSEWNKILTGKFAMELTLKLLECGTNEYIGIPKQIDVDNFQIVYQRALANNITLKPISLIISMLRDECEVMTLHKRLKLSNSERDLAFFLIQHREPKLCMDNPLRPYQSLVFVQSTNKHNVYREYIKEVLKYLGAMQLLDEFEKWVIPRFPISGESLRKYDVERPKTYGYIINRLKQIWVTEDFKLTTEQLMQKIPDIIDEVEGRK